MTKSKLLHFFTKRHANCSDFARRSRDSIHTAARHDTDRTVLSCLAGGVNWASAAVSKDIRRAPPADSWTRVDRCERRAEK